MHRCAVANRSPAPRLHTAENEPREVAVGYELMVVDELADTRRLIGRYPDYRSAVRARVHDVLHQLRRNGGSWTRVEHLIVGPGVDGPRTPHPFCTELGVDTSAGREPTDKDFEEDQRWLYAAHELDLPDGVGMV